jgi:hypothetical protein
MPIGEAGAAAGPPKWLAIMCAIVAVSIESGKSTVIPSGPETVIIGSMCRRSYACRHIDSPSARHFGRGGAVELLHLLMLAQGTVLHDFVRQFAVVRGVLFQN